MEKASMTTYRFTADELEGFYRVLDSVVCEVAERGIPLTVYEMISRLFTAAERGVANTMRLREAILRGNADEIDNLLPGRRYGAGMVEVAGQVEMRAA